MDFNSLKAGYTALLSDVKIYPLWDKYAVADADKILAGRSHYEEVQAKTNVPWYVIGVIHLMEGNLNWGTYLGNGQSLAHVTTMVPRGRGPFHTWVDGAVDALLYMNMNHITDWSDEQVCYQLEKYNGFGYRSHAINSPYLWSGTQHYDRGKFLETPGKASWFSPQTVSGQIGAVPVLIELKNRMK